MTKNQWKEIFTYITKDGGAKLQDISERQIHFTKDGYDIEMMLYEDVIRFTITKLLCEVSEFTQSPDFTLLNSVNSYCTLGKHIILGGPPAYYHKYSLITTVYAYKDASKEITEERPLPKKYLNELKQKLKFVMLAAGGAYDILTQSSLGKIATSDLAHYNSTLLHVD